MKLSDVVGGAGLAGYAEIALLIFFTVFVGVALYVLFSRRSSFERAAHMPLDDDLAPPSPRDSVFPNTASHAPSTARTRAE